MSSAPFLRAPSGAGPALPFSVAAGIACVFWAQQSWVRSTNFSGADEWLCLDLVSRGVLGVPYADRPLVFLWTAIPATICPNHLGAYWLAHGLYLMGAGLLAGWLAGRIVPGNRPVALIGGAAACLWAPLDFMRLDAVLLISYSGCTMGILAALVLLLEFWRSPRLPLFVLGGGLAFVTALGFEGALPMLALGPALPWLAGVAPPRRALAWASAWAAALAGAAAATAPRALLAGRLRYQASGLGFDPHPLRVALRLGRLLGLQLHPLATSPWSELWTPPVALAVAVFVAFLVLAARHHGDGSVDLRRRLWRLAAAGLALVVCGTLPFALSPAVQGPARTQILAGPGFGLAVAGVAGLLGLAAPRRLRPAVLGLLGAWVVAVGTGRVVAMQREWDAASSYPAQHRTLAGLLARAPALRPGTLVVLLDDAGQWPFGFAFHHAVELLYPGQAIGLVPGANDFLYPWQWTPQGVAVVPWASIRDAWGERPSLHPWSSLVVARLPPNGPLEVVDRWPDGRLPAAPAGAGYEPRARIVPAASPPPSRAILDTRPYQVRQ